MSDQQAACVENREEATTTDEMACVHAYTLQEVVFRIDLSGLGSRELCLLLRLGVGRASLNRACAPPSSTVRSRVVIVRAYNYDVVNILSEEHRIARHL